MLEEDTKDDSWSSSFGPEHSSGPASELFNQTVPAAATSALYVTQQLGAECEGKQENAYMQNIQANRQNKRQLSTFLCVATLHFFRLNFPFLSCHDAVFKLW